MKNADPTEKIKELLLRTPVFGGYDEINAAFAVQLAQQLAPEIEKMMPRESWSRDLPNKQGYWWQWDGADDSIPMVWSVLFCGTANDYFCSLGQNGLSSAVDCKEMGGWWKFCPIPDPPKIEPIPKGPTG